MKCTFESDDPTNVATTTAKGKAIAKPTAESKIHKLRLGAEPGCWTLVNNSRADDHGHLSNEG